MFKNFFRSPAEIDRDRIETYLSESYDLVDLENRIRQIDRGQAPWQIQGPQELQRWSY